VSPVLIHEETAHPSTGTAGSGTAGRLAAALKLLALGADLQRLGYAYESYQLREAAGRLLHDAEGEAS
jgi:hypothetical protein